MSTIGQRLRDERERIGMNQNDFGTLGGVQRRAQINYEADERMPDAGYLAAVASVGVDVLFVLTGQRGMQPTPGPALRDGEAELLEGYRALSAREKLGVKALIAGMAPAGSVNVQVSGGTTGHVVTGGHVVIKQTTASTPRRKSTKKV